jgi:glutamine synthetase
MLAPLSRSARTVYHAAPKSFAFESNILAWRKNFPDIEKGLQKPNWAAQAPPAKPAEAPKTASVQTQKAAPAKSTIKGDFIVAGAGGLGSATNGAYVAIGRFNGKLLYKKPDGSAIIYFRDKWKINDEDDTSGWLYSHGSTGSEPPVGGWTTEGYNGGSADPPPKVQAANVNGAPAKSPDASNEKGGLLADGFRKGMELRKEAQRVAQVPQAAPVQPSAVPKPGTASSKVKGLMSDFGKSFEKLHWGSQPGASSSGNPSEVPRSAGLSDVMSEFEQSFKKLHWSASGKGAEAQDAPSAKRAQDVSSSKPAGLPKTYAECRDSVYVPSSKPAGLPKTYSECCDFYVQSTSPRIGSTASVKQAASPASGAAAPKPKGGLLDGYGEHSFKGTVADRYLAQVGLPAGTIEAGKWHKDKAMADKVAMAVLKWATDNDASVFCHWFQPLGSSGVRHGQSGQVQNAFFNFDKAGVPQWDLKGKDLIQGETDGSSYPTGGLRATHTAGGYVTVDPSSPMWLRGDTVFIPAAFMSYHGHAIDEKTPLLRSAEALNREGTRLLSLLGYEVSGLGSHIGLEQEFFLIPRSAYMQRQDLQMAGRTLFGMDAPRGQEMCDHYMGPPSLGSSAALACMKEIQKQCYMLGIPLKTRHREVAPGQFEFAPYFGAASTQIDQNLMVMQIIEEVASTHGLAALFQEKPFNNVNGSGKHNNWSLITSGGVNLLNVGQINQASGNPDIFPVIMSAIVSAVDAYGDLMRLAIATPGNDFRLGACEAPPAIVSTYLGEDLTNFLTEWKDGKRGEYKPRTKELSTGNTVLAPVIVPSEDRNRTSPFPYGGHRFEFRAVGSSQNVSIVNTVLNTMCAGMFRDFADAIERKADPREVASKALNDHWKVIFNGNNYDERVQNELTAKGVWRIDSGVDAVCRFTDPKNTSLFSSMVCSQPRNAHRVRMSCSSTMLAPWRLRLTA